MSVSMESCAKFIRYVKEWKRTVVCADLKDRTVDYRIEYKQAVLLAMGNEQVGLSQELMTSPPHLVKLPMNGKAASLNLAVATGVMLYKTLERANDWDIFLQRLMAKTS